MSKGRHSLGAFRKSALQYAVGRIGNAVLSLGIFVWLARTLSIPDYAAYVVVIAGLEILLVAGNIGLDWVTAIEIPRLQVQGAGLALKRFVLRCLGLLALSFGLLALLAGAAAQPLGQLLGNTPTVLVQWYAGVLFVEGLSRAIRDQVLASMLLQWAGQLAQTLRNLVVVAVLGLLHWRGQTLDVGLVAMAELAASSVSLVVGAALLWYRLSYDARHHPGSGVVPSFRAVRGMALNAWISALTNLAWGGQVIVLLVSRLMGAETAALVGFARNLAEQLRKLMPIEFLFHLLRTYFVARFAAERDVPRLLGRAALAVKLNLVVVLPLVLSTFLHGDVLCSLISRGRYADAHWVAVGWLAWVVVWSHHRLADAVAHLLGQSIVIGRTSLLMLAMPLAYAVALAVGGLLALFAVLVVGEALYAWLVLRRSLAGRARYPLGRLDLPKLLVASVLALLAGSLLQQLWPQMPLPLNPAAMLGTFGLFVWLLRPWSPADRQLILERTA